MTIVFFDFETGGLTPAPVAQAFGISADGAHDALTDCRLAFQVARAMREAW